MSVFQVSPVLFFFIAISPFTCINAALLILKKLHGLHISKWREILKWVFTAYIIFIISVTLFPIRCSMSVLNETMPVHVIHSNFVNLIPFKTLGQEFNIADIIFSLLLFVPLGFLFPLISSRFRKYLPCFFMFLIISCLIEIIKLIEAIYSLSSGRIADINEVIFNILGAGIGYFLLFFCLRNVKE